MAGVKVCISLSFSHFSYDVRKVEISNNLASSKVTVAGRQTLD